MLVAHPERAPVSNTSHVPPMAVERDCPHHECPRQPGGIWYPLTVALLSCKATLIIFGPPWFDWPKPL